MNLLKQNFEKQLEKLKSLIGAENVVEHKGTEVVENKLDATKNKCEVKYKKVGSDEVVTQDFDLMTIGAGRLPYEAPENDFGGKYVSKIWPISNVDKAIDAAILQAKKEGKEDLLRNLEKNGTPKCNCERQGRAWQADVKDWWEYPELQDPENPVTGPVRNNLK